MKSVQQSVKASLTTKERLLNALREYPSNWVLTPLDGNKRPLRTGWQKENPLSREEITRAIHSGALGLGLRTGPISGGILSIDFDGASSIPLFVERFGEVPMTQGFSSLLAKGVRLPERFQLLFDVPETFWEAMQNRKVFKSAVEGEQLELRWTNCQSVLPGSMHPKTGCYRWLPGRSPAECPTRAVASNEMIEALLVDPTEQAQPKIPYQPLQQSHLSDTDWALSYLAALSPGRADNYDEWLAVGMALHSVDDRLLSDWDAWSRGSAKYKPGECDRKWKSFSRTGVSIGTLAHMAKQDGWVSPVSSPSLDGRGGFGGSGGSGTNSTGNSQDDPDERLKLDIKLLASEHDSLKYKRLRADICRRSGLTKAEVDEEVLAISGATSKPKATRHKSTNFLTLESPGLPWLFPGVLPGLGVSLWGGDPGIGKTTLAIDCGISVAVGEEFLGELPTKKGKVLFVCSDELPAYARDKLIDRNAPLDDSWEAVTDWDVSQMPFLERTVEDHQSDLLIIDCLASIHKDAAFDENSAQAKQTLYKLEALSHTYGCAIILLHHLNKSKDSRGVNKIRGSSAIAAAVSTVALFELSPNGETRYLHFPKIRGAEPQKLTCQLDRTTGRYTLVSGGADDSTKSLSERLMAFFNRLPEKRFELSEIKAALSLDDSHNDALYKSLSRLVQRNQLIRRQSKTNYKIKVWGVPQMSLSEDSDPSPPLIYTPTRLKNVQKEGETHIHQDFHSLDTHWTNSGHQEECPMTVQPETLTNQDIHSLDTLGDEGIYEGVSSEEETPPPESITQQEYPSSTPWMDEENLEAIAADLSACEDSETLVLVLDCYRPQGLSDQAIAAACNRLSPEKQAEVTRWLNELSTSTD